MEARGKRNDIDAAERQPKAENWEVRVNQSNHGVAMKPVVQQTRAVLGGGAGMEPAGAERHRRSPKGELSGDSESIEPARGNETGCPTNPSGTWRRGREWSRREPSDIDEA